MSEAFGGLVPVAELAAYGLLGAFGLALLERLIPIVPSYGLFIFLGTALAARPLDLVPLVLATTLASTLGALCWYGLGRGLGEARTHRLVRRFGRYVGLREPLYLSLAARYSRHAFIATLMGQIVPIVRVYLSLPAGILALPPGTFALAVFAGSALWIGGFEALGFGLHVMGWDPLTATLAAIAVLLAVEASLAWVLARRRSPA